MTPAATWNVHKVYAHGRNGNEKLLGHSFFNLIPAAVSNSTNIMNTQSVAENTISHIWTCLTQLHQL